ncbi:hypothetical protein BS50DRAFT_273292 [Corynespora cassiicola Philippines]|uniref:Uncharacterized protein n=1 Tax=Corynespora cassiicola Philippines TaxID=1448308 RepID=A0A2T2P073_CORCC|nr:hypothetical protein BS50DRAFT_273292 [Corynespora cassiicola Philippines]
MRTPAPYHLRSIATRRAIPIQTSVITVRGLSILAAETVDTLWSPAGSVRGGYRQPGQPPPSLVECLPRYGIRHTTIQPLYLDHSSQLEQTTTTTLSTFFLLIQTDLSRFICFWNPEHCMTPTPFLSFFSRFSPSISHACISLRSHKTTAGTIPAVHYSDTSQRHTHTQEWTNSANTISWHWKVYTYPTGASVRYSLIPRELK